MLFSGVFEITERRDVGLYEVPFSVSCWVLGCGLCQLPYVRYYVVVRTSFKHIREECESMRVYVL